MGIRIVVGVACALLLSIAAASSARADAPLSIAGVVIQAAPGLGGSDDGGIFKFEEDLRTYTFQFLKSIRRWSIRIGRLFQRSAVYWAGWIATASGLLLFGGLVSAIDRRILIVGWKRGVRVALAYAWIGLVVFLRLLRDPRVAGRLRLILPLALLYGVFSSRVLELGDSFIDPIDELLVVGLASRWFVRRCPDEIVEQHAAHARDRARAVLPTSFEQQS